MDETERKQLARKRLTSVLTKHVIANLRTLEQKISDAGPNNQRIDPHILTPVRKAMEEEGVVARRSAGSNTWYYLGNTSQDLVETRLVQQVADFKAFTGNKIPQRIGQALEIATYRALMQGNIPEFFGRYTNLDAHDDSTLYSKQEPPQYIGGLSLPGDQCLDFMVRHDEAGYLGLECKNIREWLYPHRTEILETLAKCVALNCVPVIIARRIPFVTFKLMSACGVIVHQTYNQLMAHADAAVAARVKHKDSLGYHDIRLGNLPDSRLLKFIGTDMMNVAPDARQKFDKFKDLLQAFSSETISYPAFAAKVRRRLAGKNEEKDDTDDEYIDFQEFG